MRNDSVREEIQSSISASNSGRLAAAVIHRPVQREDLLPNRTGIPRPRTGSLQIKQTSPTLVEFQSKNATLPDWRLQLQNSIRKRNGASRGDETEAVSGQQTKLVTSGANALKAEIVEEAPPSLHTNARVASALRRIEESRKAFCPEPSKPAGKELSPARNYPFNVVSRSADLAQRRSPEPEPQAAAPKPKLVSPLRIEKRKFDTNKLPPIDAVLPPVQGTDTETKIEADAIIRNQPPTDVSRRIEIKEQFKEHEPSEIVAEEVAEVDDFDDLAPIAMRFNAGLFDLIIGGIVSFVLVSPLFMFGDWMSLSGLIAFAAVFCIVMFVYLTAAVSFTGRTFGMRVFSLELIDAHENAYPTLHQAAVNSSVFLLSLAACGLGFVTIFFNDEKRAAHDLAAGTVLVREF